MTEPEVKEVIANIPRLIHFLVTAIVRNFIGSPYPLVSLTFSEPLVIPVALYDRSLVTSAHSANEWSRTTKHDILSIVGIPIPFTLA